jgi:quercetin dioxygenase-like cupin family protein
MSAPRFLHHSEGAAHDIFPGVRIQAAAGTELMLSYVTFEPNAIVEAHSHPHEQAGMVVSGSARFIVGDQERVLRPGDLYFIPGGVTHRVVATDEGCVALDVFHPVREDYL